MEFWAGVAHVVEHVDARVGVWPVFGRGEHGVCTAESEPSHRRSVESIADEPRDQVGESDEGFIHVFVSLGRVRESGGEVLRERGIAQRQVGRFVYAWPDRCVSALRNVARWRLHRMRE